MKVVGSGSPAALTLRLGEREIKALSEELEQRRQVADEAVQNALDQGRDLSAIRDHGRTPAEVVRAILVMQDTIARTGPNGQGRYVVTGPTWLLAPAIRGASVEASERLFEALRRFVDEETLSAEELHRAVSDASDWSETLIGLDHTEKYGLPG